jgi:hypothetical protein
VILALAGPHDESPGEQWKLIRADVLVHALAEPDLAPLHRSGVEGEGGQTGIDLVRPEGDLDLHRVDPRRETGVDGQQVAVVRHAGP